MNTKSQQQIAREAAAEIHWHHVKSPDAYGQEEAARTTKIILSAIERATEHLYKLLDEQGARNWKLTAQPQRSEQQEWTPERLWRYFAKTAPPPRQHVERLADDINAALTIEHQRRDQAEHELDLANARKPLLDLLLEIRELMPDWTMKDLKDRIDALAK